MQCGCGYCGGDRLYHQRLRKATVADGQPYNLRTIAFEDCVFDRGEASHATSLWDMNAKYAEVLQSAGVLEHLGRLEGRQGSGGRALA